MKDGKPQVDGTVIRGLKTICIAATKDSSPLQAIAAACARLTVVKGDTLSVGILAQRTPVGNR